MNQSSSTLGVVMLDLEGLTLDAAERDLLLRPAVGGLILFSRNYQSPGQLCELIAALRACRQDLLIAVDQEGGRVQRFRDGFLELPALHKLGLCFEKDPESALELARQCGWAMAAEVLHFGIDFSFAPVLDLYNPVSRVIGARAFSDRPEVVIRLAEQYIAGMNEAGMAATGKHYPGHGSVDADSHHELPRDERDAEQILQGDYSVFAGCIPFLTGIMPAHVVYPAIDEQCAGYSRVWIQDKLRAELNFDGVVFSDDLTMAAAQQAGDAATRASLALDAGCDMVLVCNDRDAALAVCDWVEERGIRGDGKLTRMAARPAAEIAELYEQEKWRQASAAVRKLAAQTES